MLSPLARRIYHVLTRLGAATLQQLIAHGWTEATPPRSARAGYLCLERLKKSGLVTVLRLDPDVGSVSDEVLVPHDWTLTRAELEAVLQQTETWLVRQREGWRAVPAAGAPAILRRAALRAWDRTPLTEGERVIREALARRETLPAGAALMARGEGRELAVRLVIPVWTLAAAARCADLLPPPIVRQFDVELVAADPAVSDRARDSLRAWVQRHRVPIVITAVAPFRRRPNPSQSTERIPQYSARLEVEVTRRPRRPRRSVAADHGTLSLFDLDSPPSRPGARAPVSPIR